MTSVCLLGFGEVGQTLAADLRPSVQHLSAWDLKFADAGSAPSRAAPRFEVLAAPDARSAVAQADVIISAVTAAQTGAAARSVAPHLKHNAYYFDLNSASPAAKEDAAGIINAAGGRFVEAAVMSPIAPRRVASPMLLGGVYAAGFLPLASQLGFKGAEVFSEKLGAASAAKMCRSVVVKGLEGLMLESLLAARHYGVEIQVLDSLKSLVTVNDWRAVGLYMISRALLHGGRRAEEMREVAHTVAEAGLSPHMSSACVEWEEWASRHSAAAVHEDLGDLLDTLLSARREDPC